MRHRKNTSAAKCVDQMASKEQRNVTNPDDTPPRIPKATHRPVSGVNFAASSTVGRIRRLERALRRPQEALGAESGFYRAVESTGWAV